MRRSQLHQNWLLIISFNLRIGHSTPCSNYWVAILCTTQIACNRPPSVTWLLKPVKFIWLTIQIVVHIETQCLDTLIAVLVMGLVFFSRTSIGHFHCLQFDDVYLARCCTIVLMTSAIILPFKAVGSMKHLQEVASLSRRIETMMITSQLNRQYAMRRASFILQSGRVSRYEISSLLKQSFEGSSLQMTSYCLCLVGSLQWASSGKIATRTHIKCLAQLLACTEYQQSEYRSSQCEYFCWDSQAQCQKVFQEYGIESKLKNIWDCNRVQSQRISAN